MEVAMVELVHGSGLIMPDGFMKFCHFFRPLITWCNGPTFLDPATAWGTGWRFLDVDGKDKFDVTIPTPTWLVVWNGFLFSLILGRNIPND